MPFSVQAKMITSAETSVTVATLEGFLACVLARVSGQLVASGKLPGTTFPFADVRLFARVCAPVSLENVKTVSFYLKYCHIFKIKCDAT